jgi:uncharacterized protein with beta-barrel porin domain
MSGSGRIIAGMVFWAQPSDYSRWSVWAAGFGGSQTTDGNAAVGSNGSTSRIVGTVVGADYYFSPNTIAGFALAGGGTSYVVGNGLGSGRSDLFQAGVYMRHTMGAAYIAGALAYGWQDITTNRTVTLAGLDQLQARFNANAFSGRLEGGYRFVTPWIGGIGITPYAAAQFTTFDLPAYAEQAIIGTNNFALAYGAKSVTDPRSELGFRTDKSFAMPDGVLTLRGRLAWAHDYDTDRSIGATFQSLPRASFVVNGAAQASDSVLTTASIERKWTNNWSIAATFEGEFAHPMQRLQIQLLRSLGRHELHRRALHGFGNRFGIIEVVLLSLAVGADIFGRHQPGIVTKRCEFAAQMMCADAGLPGSAWYLTASFSRARRS